MLSEMNILLANFIAIFHATWVAWLFIGTICALLGILHNREKLYFSYATVIIGTAFSNGFLGYCLFTQWEQQLRFISDPHLYKSYTNGFAVHYADMLGIGIQQETVFWMVHLAMIIGILSIFFWRNYAERAKILSHIVCTTYILIFSSLFVYDIHAEGGGGGGGGGPDCTGLIDLSILTEDEKYLPSMPTDPSGAGTNGSGYFVSISSDNRVTVNAPSAENGETISITR